MGYLQIFLFSFVSTALPHAPFTDSDYQAAIAQSKTVHHVILYTWSPHMVLSQKGLDEILSQRRNQNPVVILDPKANRALAVKIAKRHHWPDSVLRENQSPQLVKKGFRVHYPSYLFLENGQIKGSVVPGYKSPIELNHLLKRFFK